MWIFVSFYKTIFKSNIRLKKTKNGQNFEKKPKKNNERKRDRKTVVKHSVKTDCHAI